MFRTDYWTISMWMLIAVIFIALSLLRFFERSQRQLHHFVTSIRNGDFSPISSTTFNKFNSRELDLLYNEIASVFRNLRDEKEFHHQYLQMLMEHMNIAIVCFTDDFNVQFANRAALELFGKPYLHNLDSFERISPDLSNAIKKVRRGENQLIKTFLNDDCFPVSINSDEFRFHDHEYKMVTFHNIKSELDRQELDSWKKLIRTITHEVNNSAIPITNLTNYVAQTILNDDGSYRDLTALEPDKKDDLRTSLQTIEKRSSGLVNFINSTRKFVRIQKPEFERVMLKDILERVIKLLSADLSEGSVETRLDIHPDTIEATLDAFQFEQVMINLILNSLDAMKDIDSPKLQIIARWSSKTGTMITVADNGQGIQPEDMGNIFVPYFTTKANGSGLGLSICRNIIDQHNGEIKVFSLPGKGTTFTIRLGT